MTDKKKATTGNETAVSDTSITTAKAAKAAKADGGTGTAAGGAVSRNFRKTRVGLVVSDKMDKTVVVAVEDRVQHALYGKILRRTNKLKAHDENNDAGIGDRVLIMETRPQSATKRWRLVEIVEKAR